MLDEAERISEGEETAIQSWEAAVARYESERALMEARMEAVRAKMELADMKAQQACRERTRAELHFDALLVWAPDYANGRAPAAVYDLRGDPSGWNLPPSPPPS